MGRRKLLGAFSILAVLATFVVVGATSVVSPAGAWVGPSSPNTAAIPMDCVATVSIVGEVPTTQDITLVTSAPNKAEAGEQFDIFSQAAAAPAPSNVQGFAINNIRQFEVRIPLPPNSSRVNEEVVGGTGFGFGSANITWDGANSRWVFTVSGPIAGGANFQFPQIRVRVQASGAPGSTIQPRLGGNSKTNFGFSLIVNANLPSPIGTTDIPTACWPKQPNPAFSTTQIIPIDTVGPVITINAPSDLGNYGLNQNVAANYNCNDGPNGTGFATCAGPVLSGSPINTSSLGVKSFTVNSTDNKGNASSKTVTYNVVDLPTISSQPSWAFEGSPATFTVSLSKPWPTAVSVNYAAVNGTAVRPADYTNTTGTLTFAPGEFSKSINVPTVNDTIYQGELEFSMQFSSPVNGLLETPSVGARILDGETPPPAAVGETVNEGPGVTVDFEVSIPFDPAVPVNVAYETVNGLAIAGNDYVFKSGGLTFNPGGPLTQTVSVDVIDDGQDDGEAIDFSLKVTNSGTGQLGEAGQAAIIDNDGPPRVPVAVGAKIGDTRVVEGDDTTRNAWLTVRLDQQATVPVTVTFTTANGTATVAGKDYQAKTNTLDFKPGQTAREVLIKVTPDKTFEGDEHFFVNLTGISVGTIGDSQGVVTIQDDDNPTATDYVVSMGDATTYEGDGGQGIVRLPLNINRKRPTGAPNYDVPVRVDIVYGSASATDVNVKNLGWTITLPGGVNQSVQVNVRGDTVVEHDEQLTVVVTPLPETPAGVTIGRSVGTLTIRDNDGVPGQPRNPRAETSKTKLGFVDFRWDAPLGASQLSGYEWRVATDGALDTELWTSTNTGLNRHVQHDCGEGATCLYQVRAVSTTGTGPPSAIVSGVGLDDDDAPELLVFAPKPGANSDSYTGMTYNGLLGTDLGDDDQVTVNVYACNNCTNIAPVDSPSVTELGAGWNATGAALAPGVYTVQVQQTDWAGNTNETLRVIETRNAVFVSATGNNANPGTAASPKQTIAAGLTTAVSDARPEVAVGQGTYGALSVTAGQGNKTVNGGFDQYAGWLRPGSAGVPGTPNQDLTNIEAGPTAVLVTGATGLTFNGMRMKGSNTSQPAGSTIYGLRAVTGANVTLQNVKVIADAGLGGTNGTNGNSGVNATTGGNGNIGGEACESGNNYIGSIVAGGAAGTGANNGGAGGVGDCRSNGGTGATGGGSGGSGGTGGANTGDLLCGNGGSGNGGSSGLGGAAGATAGAAGSGGTSGATWAGNSGGNGTSGTAGRGGGGGGGGGGSSANIFGGAVCDGFDAGGSGGGGGGGGGAGLLGTGGTAGGGSFGVYANASSVSIDSLSSVTAGAGGKGGDGGNGGGGGNGGAGGRGGSVTNSNNNGNPTGNASPFPCGLFFPACYADGGPGAGGAGGGAGGGATGGGGGAGGPSAAVFHSGTGSVSVLGATVIGAGGAGGSGGTAGANGLRGESGPAAPGAWTTTANAGAQGGNATGSPTAGGNGGAGFACRVFDVTCILP
jgi:hypothetical protein